MKQPIFRRFFLTASMSVALMSVLVWSSSAKAELVRDQPIQNDSAAAPASPGSPGLPPANEAAVSNPAPIEMAPNAVDEVIVVKKPVAPPVAQPTQASAPGQFSTVTTTFAQTQQAPAAPQADAAKQAGIGNSIDNSISAKMDGVKQQFEEKIVKMLDQIKISVDDGQSTQAIAQPQAPAPVLVAAATTGSATTIVKDSVINANAAPESALPEAVDSAKEKSKDSASAELGSKNRVALFPMAGITNINNTNNTNLFTVNPRYSAGIGIEVQVADNLSFVSSYTYSQYNLSLGSGNPYYGAYNSPVFSYNGSNFNALTYNQNMIDAGLRFYLTSRGSTFRPYVGAGAGYGMGYLNYNQATLNAYSGNPYYGNASAPADYEIDSVVGHLETGADVMLSKSVSLGMGFKYDTILSSSQNANNGSSYLTSGNYGYGYGTPDIRPIVGNSLSQDSFYSFLANLKFSF